MENKFPPLLEYKHSHMQTIDNDLIRISLRCLIIQYAMDECMR